MKEITKKWLQFAKGDLEAAEVLLKSAKTDWSYQLCVLHCHQAIEKILKAVIINKGEEPKRVHNLIFLLEKSGLRVTEEFRKYVEELNPHYQPSRYPDIRYKGPILKYNQDIAKYHFSRTKEVFSWIQKKFT